MHTTLEQNLRLKSKISCDVKALFQIPKSDSFPEKGANANTIQFPNYMGEWTSNTLQTNFCWLSATDDWILLKNIPIDPTGASNIIKIVYQREGIISKSDGQI